MTLQFISESRKTSQYFCFSRQLQLKKHTDTHSERRPFACEQCPRRFRDFCCPLCAKTFKTRTGLKKHQLVHTDARPFVCAVCQKGFKTKYNLRAHEALNATKTFQDAVSLHEQPHTCTACGKAFTRRSSLRGHQAVHRGKIFTCEVCGTGFSLQHNLRRHTPHDRTVTMEMEVGNSLQRSKHPPPTPLQQEADQFLPPSPPLHQQVDPPPSPPFRHSCIQLTTNRTSAIVWRKHNT
ncbi:Zinc finger protein 226 [Oryzias melastigma]|uniref:Zinc finger protein 226 n=1 Tax=Oryzias melastigma TaxID=30732 RepID=A0A834CN07_ORYME|nr:Zinc finger protein 226 [Oryzias melastigma]